MRKVQRYLMSDPATPRLRKVPRIKILGRAAAGAMPPKRPRDWYSCQTAKRERRILTGKLNSGWRLSQPVRVVPGWELRKARPREKAIRIRSSQWWVNQFRSGRKKGRCRSLVMSLATDQV